MSELAEILASLPALFAACVFVFSLLVGSFLNVVIHRLPLMLERQWQAQAREVLTEGTESAASTPVDLAAPEYAVTESVATEPFAPDTVTLDSAAPEFVAPEPVAPAERYNLVVPRSCCPKCGAAIKAHQNIPLLSWLLLGGKCASCRAPISVRYPLVELVTALLSAAVALRFGWHWQTPFLLVLTWALVALTVIDLDHTLLPDVITLPLLWLGLLCSLGWHMGLTPPAPTDPVSAIIGAAAGYLVLWSVYWAFKLLTGKEGMGYGDFKLLGALGAWLGWQMLPLVLLLSALAGAVVGIALIAFRGRDRNVPIPFGPYLAVAGWIALMWGPQIMGGYLALAGLQR